MSNVEELRLQAEKLLKEAEKIERASIDETITALQEEIKNIKKHVESLQKDIAKKEKELQNKLNIKESLELEKITADELTTMTKFINNFYSTWKDAGEPPNHDYNKDGDIVYAKVTISCPSKFNLYKSFRSYAMAVKLDPEECGLDIPDDDDEQFLKQWYYEDDEENLNHERYETLNEDYKDYIEQVIEQDDVEPPEEIIELMKRMKIKISIKGERYRYYWSSYHDGTQKEWDEIDSINRTYGT